MHGTITTVEWINPHVWIHLAVTNPQGKLEVWSIEAASVNMLSQLGLTKQTLKPGTEVTVDGFPDKSVSLSANGQRLTLPNGKTVFWSPMSTDGSKLVQPPKSRLP